MAGRLDAGVRGTPLASYILPMPVISHGLHPEAWDRYTHFTNKGIEVSDHVPGAPPVSGRDMSSSSGASSPSWMSSRRSVGQTRGCASRLDIMH